jgi:hypothetical protein
MKYKCRRLTIALVLMISLAAVSCSVEAPPTETPAAPAAPTTLSAEQTGEYQVTASWPPSSGADSYNLYWSDSQGVTISGGVKITGIAGTRHRLAVPSNGTFYYIVTAVNSAGESSPSVEASAQVDLYAWSSVGGGADGTVLDLALDSNDMLYAGGTFQNIGGHAYQYLAGWDGAAWSTMVEQGNAPVASISALAVDSSGDLYINNPLISQAHGGSNVHKVVRWDGTSWSDLGENLAGSAWAIAFDSAGNVYAGGDMQRSETGVVPVHFVVWDGPGWSVACGDVNGPIGVIARDDAGRIFVGGSFTSAGSTPVPASSVAYWDGSAWHALGDGTGGTVYALAFDSAGRLFAGGNIQNSIVKWDGSSWSTLGNGIQGQVNAIAVDFLDNVYVGGIFSRIGAIQGPPDMYIAKWDGSSWSLLAGGPDGQVQALTLDARGNLYVGGGFTNTDAVPGTANIARCGH